MEVSQGRTYDVQEATQVGEARRGAMTLSRELGLDEVAAGRVGIVVTEAATNMVKHACGGQLLLQALEDGGAPGVGTLALDHGPGMADPARMMRDGFSTSGTSGTGLGAITRQASEFDVYSAVGKGTALFAGVWPAGAPPATHTVVGGLCVPLRGETACGDFWSHGSRGGRLRVLLSDGVGHGVLAHEAAARAASTFRANLDLSLEELIRSMHEALRPTRGAAVGVAEIVPARRLCFYCGVGNIGARIFSENGERHLVSHFGTLGHNLGRVQAFEYEWPKGAVLVLHSDGLATRWTLGDYPGLARRQPALIAGVLYRDHARGRDDCGVVVARDAT